MDYFSLLVIAAVLVIVVWASRTFAHIAMPDDLPQLDRPVITVGLISLCTGIFFAQVFANVNIISEYGTVPAAITGTIPTDSPLAELGLTRAHGLLTLLTGNFLHSGIFHLAGNMLFLWIFGRHFDDLMEWPVYLGFVIVCAVASSLAFVLFNPHAAYPSVGASGFVAGLMGAYLTLFPKAKLYQYLRVPFTMQPVTIALPAWVYLLFWIGEQIYLAYRYTGERGGVDFAAHIGGFLTGAALGWTLDRIGLIASYAPDTAKVA